MEAQTTPDIRAEIPGLKKGRIVHYTPAESDGFKSCEPLVGVVVKVWDTVSGCVNLNLLLDGTNDFATPANNTAQMQGWVTSRMYSEEPKPGTWRFIARD